MNQANLNGYLDRDPEQTQIPRGKDEAELDLTASERGGFETYTDSDGQTRSYRRIGKEEWNRMIERLLDTDEDIYF